MKALLYVYAYHSIWHLADAEQIWGNWINLLLKEEIINAMNEWNPLLWCFYWPLWNQKKEPKTKQRKPENEKSLSFTKISSRKLRAKVVKSLEFKARETGFETRTCHLSSLSDLGQTTSFAKPSFPHLSNRNNNTNSYVLGRIKQDHGAWKTQSKKSATK